MAAHVRRDGQTRAPLLTGRHDEGWTLVQPLLQSEAMGAVVDLEAIVVSVPAEGNAFTDTDTEHALVIVTDEDGRTGIGECSCARCFEGVARVPPSTSGPTASAST